MEFLNIPSTLIVSLLSFLLFLSIILKSLTISKATKAYSHFPGPKPLPLIGNLHLMLRAATPHHMLRDLAAKYGPLMHLQFGEIPFLLVSSVDLAKHVMKTHDINFANRPPGLVPEILGYNYSDVAFAPYGDRWRQLKKIITQEVLNARRVQSFQPLREEENMNLAKYIASRQGTPTNLSKKLCFFSYDVITRATVGSKMKERVMMTTMINRITKLASGFMITDLYPSSKLVSLITGARFKILRMRRNLDKLLDSIIEQRRVANADGGEDLSMLDVLLKIQQDGEELPLTNENIKALLMDMFIGGIDTTTTTVEWAMSEMIRNPSKLSKAQAEVRKVFDDKGYVDEEKFEDLKYLKLIIKETMRLHPPAPLVIPRYNIERCEINGYEIPAKSRVIVNAWAMGRDPEYWNEPEKFEPERFEESSIDYKGNNLEFIPFGAGRRICPGMAFGLANVHFLLATLLYHFDWKMPFGLKNEELDMTEAFGAGVNRKHQLHLIPIIKRPLPAAA